jgi:antitoxin VapB
MKDPEAHRLGTITRPVKESLRERLQRIVKRNGKAPLEELLAIARRSAFGVNGPYLDNAKYLYDEHGLPR